MPLLLNLNMNYILHMDFTHLQALTINVYITRKLYSFDLHKEVHLTNLTPKVL